MMTVSGRESVQARCYTSYLAGYAQLDKRHDKCNPPLCPIGPPQATYASKLVGAGTTVAGDNMFKVPRHTPVILHEVFHILLVVNCPDPFQSLSYIAVGAVFVPYADA